MSAPPKWAQTLYLDAAVWWQSQGHTVPSYNLEWRRCSRRSSSGIVRLIGTRITINAGTDRLDAKMVLLHELAHTFTEGTAHHGPQFWDTAWTLYRWAKLPMRYCQRREYRYRREAKAAYARVLAHSKERADA